MAFWSKERIESEQAQQPLVTQYTATHVEQSAYALGVAGEYAITTPDGGGIKKVCTSEEHITIPPGQFALLLTEETISIPENAIAFISMKAKFKLRGLINVSGFHVDPGFRGRLKFAVYNTGSVAMDLKPGQRLFLIWFADLDQPTKALYSGSQGQDGITADDVTSIRGVVMSAAAINSRVRALEDTVKDEVRRLEGKVDAHQNWARPIITGIAVGLAFVLLNALAKPWLESLARNVPSPSSTLTQPAAQPQLDGGSGKP